MTIGIYMTIQKKIPAGQFKTHCLQLMDEIKKNHTTIIITKRGIPVAKLIPFDNEPVNLFGALKSNIHIKGDIIAPMDESWDVE